VTNRDHETTREIPTAAAIPPPPPPAAPPAGWMYHQQPAPRPRKQRSLLLPVGIAAVVTGAVLGAGVAIPVTWAVAEQAPAASGGAEAGQQPGVPDQGGSDGLVPDDLGPWSGEVPGQPDQTGNGSFEDATSEQSTGVVLVDVATPNGEGAGTGWVLDESGVVVTNYHVVASSTAITVTDPATGTSYEAAVLGRDASADVAVLQLADASDLTPVTLDDDEDPAVGDDVTAVGNPGGQGFLSASSGDVVALDQSITTTDPAGGSAHPLEGLIETDAYVVGGFSGGVLLDDEGEVVGITTAASSGGPAESYAVPIEDAIDVVEEIQADDESGSVVIGPNAYLGISVDTSAGGVAIVGVEQGGPAADAGIARGSVITALDGTPVQSLDELQAVLAEHEPGDEVAISWTDASGAAQEGTVTLAESPVN
jgi:S1-C subfamily serine protease